MKFDENNTQATLTIFLGGQPANAAMAGNSSQVKVETVLEVGRTRPNSGH